MGHTARGSTSTSCGEREHDGVERVRCAAVDDGLQLDEGGIVLQKIGRQRASWVAGQESIRFEETLSIYESRPEAPHSLAHSAARAGEYGA